MYYKCDNKFCEYAGLFASEDELKQHKRIHDWHKVGKYDVFDKNYAAIRAEKFYSNETNKYRNESIETAAFIDGYICGLYSKHNCQCVVDNSLTFEAKIQRTINMIKECIEIEPRDYLM